MSDENEPAASGGHHAHEHGHDHHHGHHHGGHHHHGQNFTDPPPDPALRIKALESLLVEKGLIDPAALEVLIDTYETKIGPRNGAKVVARAWTDPDFKDWLLRDGTAAIHSMGFTGRQGEHMRVLENTPTVHNVVVCTLCSCYPWAVLGLPPVWYKSAPYRSRVVSDPRGVLGEFGTELPDDVEIRVWDSTSEMRFMVLPMRPSGTDGMSAEELEAFVTRNSMIGVEPAKAPGTVAGKEAAE
ncbi:nitrile hydratase subunit alpha [Hwanghaeella grinnelliae]|uniref:nitrile hydratase n=1 Tax=Hwanghaeella grinnelliae TaxID=2500179 RepID=A0A437QPZ8_9PROT|nr:nitrile hydratase subunit alpha [Hwanghaeella grinnelliae]RVU36517.1 nitrile hydratase subunit alpha [Hwanghaeella grinnelliae]